MSTRIGAQIAFQTDLASENSSNLSAFIAIFGTIVPLFENWSSVPASFIKCFDDSIKTPREGTHLKLRREHLTIGLSVTS